MTWIPTPIYKPLPYIYILVGVVCFFQNPLPWAKILYLFSGSVLILAGLIVISWRRANHKFLTRLEKYTVSPLDPFPLGSDQANRSGQPIDIT